MIGFSLALTAQGRIGDVADASIAFLLTNAEGFHAGPATPAPFTPAALIPTGANAFYAGSYAPAPFTPSLLFGTATAGHLSGGYEVTT